METPSPRLPSVAAKPATLFVALDLSKSTWLVAIHSPAAGKISQPRLAGGDTTALPSLIERKRGEAQAALLLADEVFFRDFKNRRELAGYRESVKTQFRRQAALSWRATDDNPGRRCEA